MSPRHFLSLKDLEPTELRTLVRRAMALKALQHKGHLYEPLKNRVLAMVFEKSSTRTRVSFETAMAQFGGHAIFLAPQYTQLGRGEPIEDTARVLSGMIDCVMIRTFEHEVVERFAQYSTVPVINALTNRFHPCQLLADMQTYFEHRGDIEGRAVAWIGDGNNMCQSYINAAHQFGFELRVACPAGYEPEPELVEAHRDRVHICRDPREAATGVDLVATDVWASMGDEHREAERALDFADYQVTEAVMACANADALFMHCLPVHRGEEVAAEVIDGSQSVVWDEAENRLHSQKALLELLLVPPAHSPAI